MTIYPFIFLLLLIKICWCSESENQAEDADEDDTVATPSTLSATAIAGVGPGLVTVEVLGFPNLCPANAGDNCNANLELCKGGVCTEFGSVNTVGTESPLIYMFNNAFLLPSPATCPGSCVVTARMITKLRGVREPGEIPATVVLPISSTGTSTPTIVPLTGGDGMVYPTPLTVSATCIEPAVVCDSDNNGDNDGNGNDNS